MATTRTPVPPGNLKDRIAALQQRNALARQSEPKSPPLNPTKATGSLRDKIASFEKQGAVPVPRGSFGLNVPPVDDRVTRSSGEMYGNRVPGLSRPHVPLSQVYPGSQGPSAARMRRVSTSELGPSALDLRDPSPPPDVQESPDPGGSQVPPSPRRHSTSSRANPGRRSVSDTLHKLSAYNLVDEGLPEGEEDARMAEDVTPVIIVSSEPPITDEPSTFSSLDAEPPFPQEPSNTRLEDVPSDSSGVPSVQGEGFDNPSQSDVDHRDGSHQQVDLDSPDRTAFPVSTSDSSLVMSPTAPSPGLRDAIVAEREAQAVRSDDTHVAEIPSLRPPSADHAEPQSTQDNLVSHPLTDLTQVEAYNVVVEEASLPILSISPAASSTSITDMHEEAPVLSPEADDSVSAVETDVKDSAGRDEDSVSATDHTSTSSSLVSTPSDHGFASSSMKHADDFNAGQGSFTADESRASDAQDAVLVSDPPQLVSPSTGLAVLIPPPQDFGQVCRDVDDVDESTDRSMALDAGDAVIVTDPARVITPAVTRAVLVPAPLSISPVSSSATASPISPADAFQEPSLTPKAGPKSFHAVVHRKVSRPAELLPGSQVPPRARTPNSQSSSSAPHPSRKAPVIAQHESMDLSDLAALLANAALLEQQLAGGGPPTRKSSLPPSKVDEPVPELRHPQPVQELPESTSNHRDSLSNSTQSFPVTVSEAHQPRSPPPRYSSTQVVPDSPLPPPVPPKSPSLYTRPRYFSTFSPRMSVGSVPPMPGAYPRNSMGSEFSVESSVLVSTPSSHHEAFGSDTSSVRSSSRSWKMPKKGLARATSFADKFLHKKDHRQQPAIADATDDTYLSASGLRPRTPSPTPPVLLSPPAQHSHSPAGRKRPTSWLSTTSSLGPNGEVLDTELFDSFPSVPDRLPPPPPSSSGQSSYSAVNRSTTLPARSKNHPRQHSAAT
ncbi:hypothetical protein B0H21DRAFT_10340 [Amylocystis lapponica]|nr:hypothetical protein B0H21DRAFT_10340 [Amylocystis lapponica]